MKTTRNKSAPWLLAGMLLVFGVAQLLPAVAVNTSFGGAWYHPGSQPVAGWMCTTFHPAGWTSVLVHAIALLFFFLFWLRRKSLPVALLLIPSAAVIYALITSVQVLRAEPTNRLLVGHYLWLASLLAAVAFFRILHTQPSAARINANEAVTKSPDQRQPNP